ncbi:MAG: hypothetical protein ABH864_00295 [archaeon]
MKISKKVARIGTGISIAVALVGVSIPFGNLVFPSDNDVVRAYNTAWASELRTRREVDWLVQVEASGNRFKGEVPPEVQASRQSMREIMDELNYAAGEYGEEARKLEGSPEVTAHNYRNLIGAGLLLGGAVGAAYCQLRAKNSD